MKLLFCQDQDLASRDPEQLRLKLAQLVSAYAQAVPALPDNAMITASLAIYNPADEPLVYLGSDYIAVDDSNSGSELDAESDVLWQAADWALALRERTDDCVVVSFLQAQFPEGKLHAPRSIALRSWVRIDASGTFVEDILRVIEI